MKAGAKRHRSDAAREEFLGRTVTVVRATDPGLIGVSGEVLDESMKTLVVARDDGSRLVLPKAAVTIRVALDGAHVDIDGRRIAFRPEDRIKKVRG